MLRKTRSGSTSSTRATVRTTTSSELSFTTTSSGSRIGAATGSSSVSDASTTMSTYSMDETPVNRIPLNPRISVINDNVDIIDELYEFFDSQVEAQNFEFEESHQKREHVLKELYESEAQYIAKIQAALEYYKKPMMANLKQTTGQSASSASLPRNFLSTNKSAGVIRGNEVELIFGNLEDLLNISRRFYNGLKERFRIWGPTQLVSDVIHTLLLDVPSYVAYLENYRTAMCALERLARAQPTRRYIEMVIEPSSSSGQTSLPTLLAQPLYTLPRYAQYLNDLVLLTDPHHPDAPQLQQCSFRMSRLDASVAQLTQACLNTSRLIDMSLLIRNCPPLLEEPRRFIMRGQLTSVSSGSYGNREDRRTYFLLSDMMIFARPRDDATPSALFYKGKIDLEGATLKELPKKKLNHPYAFEIAIDSSDPTYKYSDDVDALLAAAGGPTSQLYYFKADSREAQMMWMSELQKVIDRLTPRRR